MAQLLTVRLNKSDQQPLGFRLQGGKDFGTPLVVQKVNVGSPAERAGLQAGDALIRVNTTDVYTLRHQDAQDAIRAAGPGLELTVQRGGSTWAPSVTPTGSLPRPGSKLGPVSPVTTTSLKATPQPNRNFGSGHNNVAKPFGYTNGNNDPVKSIVNKQYNTPVNMYSDQTIAETLSAQTEVLAGGVLGVNFKKNEKTYDAEKSAVFKVLQEEQNDPEPEVSPVGPGVAGLRHVSAPAPRPDAPINNTGGLPPGQNICEDCERLITGVFVRIKDKNLHVECFKCATCGTSLKNQGYYNLNGKLYCDIHAKLIARQNPPSANLEPVTVPPGGRIPPNSYSTPLPPLSTNNYSNGSSSMFSPSSNLSGPKPFGSSIGSAYSPSLSPRSAPLSPARPVTAPAPAPPFHPAAAYNPAPAFNPAPAYNPAPAPAPAYTPAAAPPFAPTNETQNTSTLSREFKSPAEERLIRKMAKMALNGYEIGIQRKIQPGDKIQSMAEKIQDTVVAKHPLNASENGISENNSRDNTLTKSTIKSDRSVKPADNIMSIADKIRETIMNNHPAANAFLDDCPPPPPLPNSPIPTFNVHSTPLPQLNGTLKRNPNSRGDSRENSPKHGIDQQIITNNMKTSDLENGHSSSEDINKENKYQNNLKNTWNRNKVLEKTPDIDLGHSSSEDINKENKHDNSFTKTLKRNNAYEKSAFMNEMSTPKPDFKINGNSNTLNKKKLFENNSLNDTNGHKTLNGHKHINGNGVVSEKKNIFDKKSDDEPDQVHKQNVNKPNGLPKSLYDNTLYSQRQTNGTNNTNHSNCNGHYNGTSEQNEDNNEEKETVVRRRDKKNRTNDGRRDSHIVTRPLSTLETVDATDGQYICNVCEEAITRGPFITALGRIWCPEHFTCVNASCRRQLQDIGFVEENGQLYCEYCFEQYIAPACDKCHAKIKGDCLNAIGKHFHPECFACVYCGKLFGNNPFFLEDGLPYCESDWNELFTTKCFACGFPVEAGDRWVEALNNNYHSQCFNCTVCKKNLEGQSFFAKGGRPFCKMHAR